MSVLLAETVVLRALNDRYDRDAKSDALSRARVVSNARETEHAQRHLYTQALTMVGEFMTAEQWSELGFATLPDAPADADRLALALDTLSTQVDAWYTTLTPEVREACDDVGLGQRLVASLREGATAVRRAQDERAGLSATTRVTQRQLDAQDGRVLHVVHKVYTAFRLAARKDKGVVVPHLGDLESVFVRDRRPSATDATDTDTAPKPDPQPDPAPTPPT